MAQIPDLSSPGLSRRIFSDPSASRSEIIPRFRLGLGAEANLQTLIAREGSGQEGREQRSTGQFSAVTTGLE